MSENWSLRLALLIAGAIIIFQQFVVMGRVQSQKVIFMPPVVASKEFWVTGNQVSTSYLEMMAQFIMYNAFNVTPANAKENARNLLALVDPDFYGEVEQKIDRQIGYLADNQISRTFYFGETNANVPGKIIVKGLLKEYVSNKLVGASDLTAQISYQIKQGRFFIVGFEVKEGQGAKA